MITKICPPTSFRSRRIRVARFQARKLMGFLFENMTPEKVPVWEWFNPDEKWIEKFWANVDNSAGPDACWPWMRSLTKGGYGKLLFTAHGHTPKYKLIGSHCAAYLLNGGVLSKEDPFVLHSCVASRACCNPAHLKSGNPTSNAEDMVAQGRQIFQAHPEKRPYGERNGSRTKPERVPRGDRHGSRTKPERVPRGDRHRSKTKPESTPRGEANGTSKLTVAQVADIYRLRGEGMTGKEIAKHIPVTFSTVYKIINGQAWSHFNPSKKEA